MRRRTRGLALACSLAILSAPAAQVTHASARADDTQDARSREVERFIGEAERLIRGHDFNGKSTAHYKLRTDDPRLDVSAAADLLEAFRSYFESFWSGRRELNTNDEPVLVFLYYSRSSLNKLLPGAPAPPDGIERVGHYQAFYDVIALHTDTVGLENLPDVLVHEAAHHMVQRRLLAPEGELSLWLSEGLATYFGNTYRDAKGIWHTGEIGGKESWIFDDKTRRSGGDLAGKDLKLFKASLFKDGGLGPDAILRMDDPARFYGEGSLYHYALSWTLVHYMLHADGGARAPGFMKYLDAEMRGDGGPEVFYKETGLAAESLDAGFRLYAKKLRAR